MVNIKHAVFSLGTWPGTSALGYLYMAVAVDILCDQMIKNISGLPVLALIFYPNTAY
jgi:hypothetical protein